MQTLQEIEVWFVLPALRRELALELLNANLRQKDIARLLDLTEAAVSQYLAGKRGMDIAFDDTFRSEIKASAGAIAKGTDLQQELQRLLRVSERHRIGCEPCPRHKIDASCEVCYH